MTTDVRVIRGMVESVTQDSIGQAVAHVVFGMVNYVGEIGVTGWIDVSGKPVKQGEMFGVQLGELRVWLAGSVVEIVL